MAFSTGQIREITLDGIVLHGVDGAAIPKGGISMPMPTIRQAESAKRLGGVVDQSAYHATRTITIEPRFWDSDPAQLQDRIDTLRGKLYGPLRPVLKLTMANGEVYRTAVRATAWDEDRAEGGEYVDLSIGLQAPDPLLYSDTTSTGSYDPTDTGSAGFDFPMEFALDFGSAESGGAFLIVGNAGNAPAPFTATITGPVINAKLISETLGKTISTTLNLSSGETAVIDTSDRSLWITTTPRLDLIDPSATEWFDLAKGSNSLRLQGSGFVAGQTELSVTFRSAYI